MKIMTERLILNELSEKDIEFIIQVETRFENKKYEMGGVLDQEEIIHKCKYYLEESKKLPESGAVRFIVSNKYNEKIGFISLTCNWEKTKEWEIGYYFLSEYWGKGFATEAVQKIIQFAFNELHIHKLMAFINYENKRSINLVKRLGMVQEGHIREARLIDGKWNDELVYSLLQSDLY